MTRDTAYQIITESAKRKTLTDLTTAVRTEHSICQNTSRGVYFILFQKSMRLPFESDLFEHYDIFEIAPFALRYVATI